MTYRKIPEAAAISEQLPDQIRVLETGHYISHDEIGIELDTGEMVAVSCRTEREPNTNGLLLKPVARVLTTDGGTAVDFEGNSLTVTFCHHASGIEVAAIGEPTLKREAMLLALGEPPGLDADGVPLLNISDAARAAVSIRTAIMVHAAADNSRPLPDDLL